MANVLLLDDDPTAQEKVRGILEHLNHDFWAFNDECSAWEFLQHFTAIDLVILEVKLTSGVQIGLLRKLRRHFFYKTLPVVVYTKLADRDIVRSTIELGIQNYLLKPYSEKHIHDEVVRALATRWQENYIEQPKVVCTRLGITQAEYQTQLMALEDTVSVGGEKLQQIAINHSMSQCQALVNELTHLGQKTGCSVLNDIALDIHRAARASQWERLSKWGSDFSVLSKMIGRRRGGGASMPVKNLREERTHFPVQDEDVPELFWKKPNFETLCPLLEKEVVLADVGALKHFPVVDTAAQGLSFALAEEVTDFEALGDYFKHDSSLLAELLRFSSSLISNEHVIFENPLSVFHVLGQLRLRSMQESCIIFPEENINNEFYNYKYFNLLQIVRARLAREIAGALGMFNLDGSSYWTSFVKDMGVLLFYYLYPDHYKNVLAFSASQNQPLVIAEALILGATHEMVGLEFAKNNHFPRYYQSVISYCSNPEEAPPEDRDLVAIVSLADFLCKSYGFNYVSGAMSDGYCNFRVHPTWEILSKRITSSFSFVAFDKMIRKTLTTAKQNVGL